MTYKCMHTLPLEPVPAQGLPAQGSWPALAMTFLPQQLPVDTGITFLAYS